MNILIYHLSYFMLEIVDLTLIKTYHSPSNYSVVTLFLQEALLYDLNNLFK